MRWVLTAGLLILSLSGWVSSSAGQTPGPGRGEVPSELWREYPLKEPPAEAREGSAKRRSPERSPERPPAGTTTDTDDGGQGTPFLLIAGVLLAIVAIVLATARRRGGKRRTTAGLDLQPALPAHSPAQDPPAPARRFKRAPSNELPPAPALSAPSNLGEQVALGYASAPAAGDANASLRLQQEAVEASCGGKGLALLEFVHDIDAVNGSDLSRPGLAYALDRLAAREASCLVVESLARLTPSATDLGTLVERLDRCGARLVVADIDLDTDTAEGRLDAKALATIGESGRSAGQQGTGERLEAFSRTAKKSSGPRTVSDEPALKRRIAEMRASGMTLQAIADALNAEGIPTLRGGIRWRPSSVQAAAGYKRPARGKSRLG